MAALDGLDLLFVVWAFFFQIALILHFAVRKRYFESYTLKYGWLVYALSLPALAVSILLLLGGKPWAFWLGGFLFLIYAAFGYWVDYIKGFQWRSPPSYSILAPYVSLYLATVMFYWWPLGLLSRTLWVIYGILFIVATVLNICSH